MIKLHSKTGKDTDNYIIVYNKSQLKVNFRGKRKKNKWQNQTTVCILQYAIISSAPSSPPFHIVAHSTLRHQISVYINTALRNWPDTTFSCLPPNPQCLLSCQAAAVLESVSCLYIPINRHATSYMIQLISILIFQSISTQHCKISPILHSAVYPISPMSPIPPKLLPFSKVCLV